MSMGFICGLEGWQKSAGQKSMKFVWHCCHSFFTFWHLTGYLVHTFLLLRVASFQPAKKINGITGPFCTSQPLLCPQAWKFWGASSFIRGHDTQDHDLGHMLCIEVYLSTDCIYCLYFLIRQMFSVSTCILSYSKLFWISSKPVSKCLRVLTNDFSLKSMFTVVLIVLGFTFCWFAIFLIASVESC